MANPFKSVQCAIRYDNARVISWSFDPSFTYPGAYTLQVENSRPGGPWTVISPSTFTNACSYVDTARRNFNKRMDESYRVRLVAGSEEYVSKPVDAGILVSYPFSAEAENAQAQIETAIRVSGVTGTLLKRKHWGERCPECTDFDGQPSVNEHCTTCFGTGFSGGYYSGISLDLIKDQVQTAEGTDSFGSMQVETVSARCLAYPYIAYGDVWVEDGTNKRYSITSAVATSTYKTVPLVYQLQLRLMEYTDASYSNPVSDKASLKDIWDSSLVDYTPSSEASAEAASKADWDAALEEM